MGERNDHTIVVPKAFEAIPVPLRNRGKAPTVQYLSLVAKHSRALNNVINHLKSSFSELRPE